MVNYNFSNDDGLNYQNLPFNQTQGKDGYESAVCVVPQLQDYMVRVDRIEYALLFLVFLVTILVGLEVLKYLKRKRQM